MIWIFISCWVFKTLNLFHHSGLKRIHFLFTLYPRSRAHGERLIIHYDYHFFSLSTYDHKSSNKVEAVLKCGVVMARGGCWGCTSAKSGRLDKYLTLHPADQSELKDASLQSTWNTSQTWFLTSKKLFFIHWAVYRTAFERILFCKLC